MGEKNLSNKYHGACDARILPVTNLWES